LAGLNMPVYRHYGNTLNHPIHTAIYEAFAYERGYGFMGGNDPVAPLQQVIVVNAPQVPDPVRRSFIDHAQLRGDMMDFLDFAESAQISSTQGDGDRAIRLLRRCLRYEPRSARMRYRLSELCAQHGYPRMAQDYIRQGLAMPDGHQYDFDFILGRVHADLGDRDQAIAAFEQSLERGPHEITYSNLGELYSETGELDEAYRCWRLALELDPTHERAAARIEWMQTEMWRRHTTDLDERFGLDPAPLTPPTPAAEPVGINIGTLFSGE
ncbi:MAG: tetratricopeptide (TPR) repeat protein, partial [Myxococcota bacterium]